MDIPGKADTMRQMRKLFSILLLFTLALSWTTSAVAVYCTHEVATAAQQHLGHHVDTYAGHDQGKTGQPAQEKNHTHCSLGNLFSGQIYMQPESFFFNLLIQQAPHEAVSRLLLSALPKEPERPKWSASA